MKDIEKLIQEIESYIEGLSESYGDPTIKVSIKDNTCIIHISKMYEGLGKMVSFQALNWLSKTLGTEEINLENEEYMGGCESCDWGSEQSVDIVCKNISLDE